MRRTKTRLARMFYTLVGIVFAPFVLFALVFHSKETPSPPKAQAIAPVVDDDPGVKPDAQNPDAKIEQVVAAFKADPKYRFLKYEVWPGEYKQQKVWEIDYHYSERGFDGVFVLKHIAVYFRGGKIVGYTEPITAEQDAKDAAALAASAPADTSGGAISHSSSGSRRSGGKSDVPGSEDGHYVGGTGSSRKGSHYENANTGNHYRSH